MNRNFNRSFSPYNDSDSDSSVCAQEQKSIQSDIDEDIIVMETENSNDGKNNHEERSSPLSHSPPPPRFRLDANPIPDRDPAEGNARYDSNISDNHPETEESHSPLSNSQQLSSCTSGEHMDEDFPGQGSKIKRKRTTDAQLAELIAIFEKNDSPNFEIRQALAKKLNMTNREVQVS